MIIDHNDKPGRSIWFASWIAWSPSSEERSASSLASPSSKSSLPWSGSFLQLFQCGPSQLNSREINILLMRPVGGRGVEGLWSYATFSSLHLLSEWFPQFMPAVSCLFWVMCCHVIRKLTPLLFSIALAWEKLLHAGAVEMHTLVLVE